MEYFGDTLLWEDQEKSAWHNVQMAITIQVIRGITSVSHAKIRTVEYALDPEQGSATFATTILF